MTWLGGARALLDAGVLLVFGTALYRLAVGTVPGRALAWLFGLGTAASWAGGVATLWLTTAGMIDDTSAGAIIGALPLVMTGTMFGPALAARVVLASLAAALARWRVASLLAAGIGAALQVGLGHPAAAENWVLPAGSVLHVLGVGGWIGSLPALILVFPSDHRAARRYIRLGLWAILALIAGAALQAWELMGGWHGLLHTGYGTVLLLKTGLLLLMLACAGINRYGLGPALGSPNRAAAARGLTALMLTAMALGLVTIILAGQLSVLPPGTEP
jgi:copper transport protein